MTVIDIIIITDMDISFVLFNVHMYLLYFECYSISPKRHKKVHFVTVWIYRQSKRYISVTKKSDTSVTGIYHAMSPTVVYIHINNDIAFINKYNFLCVVMVRICLECRLSESGQTKDFIISIYCFLF
jgi:hypothetical protein